MNDKSLLQVHALNARGDSAAAGRLLTQILRKEPLNVPALIAIAEIEITAEHYDTAANACKKPFVSAVTTPTTLTVLARTCWLSGDVTQALNHVRRYEH